MCDYPVLSDKPNLPNKECSMNKFRLLILIAIGLSVTGCASQKAWKYGAEPFVNGIPPLVNKTVVVTPFNDQRINENDDKIALYLIPLMPFG